MAECLLYNPPLVQVNLCLHELANRANESTFLFASLYISADHWRSDTALHYGGGSQIPSWAVHPYLPVVQCTVVGCAWATYGRGRAVRLQADLVPALHRRVAQPFGLKAKSRRAAQKLSAMTVFESPDLEAVRAELLPAVPLWGIAPTNTLAVVADWLEDQGHETKAIREFLMEVRGSHEITR